jgi:hypothetical protein
MSENRSEKFWKSLPRTIHWEELAIISGLTKQRIWQLHNKEGRIPVPDRGMFPFRQTMIDIFKYYRAKSGDNTRTFDAASRIKEADAKLKEDSVRKNNAELVDVLELAERMGKPLEAMRKFIMDNPEMNRDAKDDLLISLQQLYGSIFGERPRSQKLLDFIKKNKIKL